MKEASWIVVAILFSLLPLGAYLVYSFPPSIARFFLILIFFIPILLITHYALKGLQHHQMKVLVILAFLAISSLVFMVRNISRLPTFLNGEELSETRLRAEQYNETGALIFSTSHSYFFQTPFLLYVISSICSISLVHASIIIIALYVILTALVSFYVAKIIMKNITYHNLSFLPYLITFSLFSSSNMMFTNVAYRYVGSVLLFLLLFFYYDRNCGENPRRTFFIVTLILTLGITIGDPTANLLMIFLFSSVSILRKNASASLYAIIPFSYMFYAAISYMFFIRKYATFVWEGFVEFFQSIFVMEIPERVAPWQRVISPTVGDTYLASVAYLSLIFLSTTVGLHYAVIWIRNRNERDGIRRSTLMKANCLSLLTMVAIGAVTYVGASVRPEVPFSDIRTIVMIFSSTLLLFSFASKTLLMNLTSNRGILAAILILSVLSSLRIIYSAYPKSFYDPINVVEDGRLGSTSIYVVADFVNAYYKTGGITGDYKALNRIGESLRSPRYEKRWLNETTLSKPFELFPYRSILVFNIAGMKYPSMYHSPDAYMAAYNFSITHNRLYDNGVVVIASREEGK